MLYSAFILIIVLSGYITHTNTQGCLQDYNLCYWVQNSADRYNSTEGQIECNKNGGKLAVFPTFSNVSQLVRIIGPIFPTVLQPVFGGDPSALLTGFYIGYTGHRETVSDQFNITEIDGTPVNEATRDSFLELEGAGSVFETCYNLVNFSISPPVTDITPYNCEERNRIICFRSIPTSNYAESTVVTNIPSAIHTNEVSEGASIAYEGITAQACCPCGGPYFPTGDVQESIEKRKKELEVDRRSLSSTIRAKTCAKDERPSSTAMGAVAVVIISVVIGGIVLLDFPLLIDMMRQIKSLIR